MSRISGLTTKGCFFVLTLGLSSCVESRVIAPNINTVYKSSIVADQSDRDLLWSISDISPKNGSILVDGIVQKFTAKISIHDNAPGAVDYISFLTTKFKDSGPAELKINNGTGSADVDFILTWLVRSHGKGQVATLSLFKQQIDQKNSHKRLIYLESKQNRYPVICNKQEFFVSLILKKFFNHCVAKPIWIGNAMY